MNSLYSLNYTNAHNANHFKYYGNSSSSCNYIYTGLQGGSIMKGWMKEENTMITCCSDGTRPVIFKIERIDY